MKGSLFGDILSNLLPAILAGVIGGLGAYVAVKVDIAVLLSNQAALIDQGKVQIATVNRHDLELSLLRYQVDVMSDERGDLRGMSKR